VSRLSSPFDLASVGSRHLAHSLGRHPPPSPDGPGLA